MNLVEAPGVFRSKLMFFKGLVPFVTANYLLCPCAPSGRVALDGRFPGLETLGFYEASSPFGAKISPP
jgi:hypothetical protein